MFQTGLFTTFIPEIIMVMAYVLCLLGSTKPIETNEAGRIEPIIIGAQYIPVSSVYHFDQSFIQLAENSEQEYIVYPFTVSENFWEHKQSILDYSLSFVQFSRPPPSFLI